MTAPTEFTPEYVKANSPREELLYVSFLNSGEPYRSMRQNNPWLAPPDPSQPLQWGTGGYWDTTVARKHPYWSKYDLPRPTRQIRTLRKDILEWGYCLIEDGMSADQCKTFHDRLRQQADAEKAAKVSIKSPAGQMINTLVNKGECFGLCIEQNAKAVQAGPVVEQLMNETLGFGWICHSFLAIGADPGGFPQHLHMDQGPLSPWITAEAPALFNTMYIPQDVDEVNGGTLLIPGSHKILSQAGTGGAVGKLPPVINLEAKAGTLMLFDGRLLHGAGANRTDQRRFVAVMSNVKQWMRTQENWVVSVAPDVLASASPKLRQRMGFQAYGSGSTIEGFGLGGTGRVGDVRGDIVLFREAYDRGEYQRVGALSPDSPAEELNKDYTIKSALSKLKAAESSPIAAARSAMLDPDRNPP